MTAFTSIRAILFDMDGVVADTEETVTAFWRDLAATHGVSLTRDDFHCHVYGLPALHTLDVLFAGLDDCERAAALALMYEGEAAGPYHAIPGALELLLTLREHAIPTALVTSAKRLKVDAVSRALGLEGLFAATVTRDDIQRGKPDPEGYRLAALRLGVDPANSLVLEDALSGVQAAVGAGTTCVGVTGPRRADALISAGAVAVVRDLRAITVDRSGGKRVLLAAGKRFDLLDQYQCEAR